MLTKITANGFRSLDGFDLDVKPGLNVLVGPNGGGKTNILALFSFISALSGDELGDAISASGGASKVFKKTGAALFGREIVISASGSFAIDRSFYLPSSYEKRILEAGVVGIRYEWSAAIDCNSGYDEAFYSIQTLKVGVVTNTLFTDKSVDWHLELSMRCDNQFTLSTKETIYDSDLINIITAPRGEQSKDESLLEIDDEYGSILPIFLSVDNSILIRRISRDLRGGSTFNFDPSACKKANDSARSASLERNGDGLAATIYAIQKSQEVRSRGGINPFRPRYDERTASTLQDYFQLINPAIHSVRADNNPIDNRIIVSISVAGDSDDVEFPLELASDGTVKWLAFTVALLTEDNGFSVEEPENFLHPDTQRHAVELVRAETEGSENLFVLMTTHSESLLNASRPEEIIVVSMDNGVTTARRLDSPELIDNEIFNTGFGLGYFYISGALSD